MSKAMVKREVTVYPALSATRSPAQQNLAINFGSAHCKALGIKQGRRRRVATPFPSTLELSTALANSASLQSSQPSSSS